MADVLRLREELLNRYERYLKENPDASPVAKARWKNGGPWCCDRHMGLERRVTIPTRLYGCSVCGNRITEQQAFDLQPPAAHEPLTAYERAMEFGDRRIECVIPDESFPAQSRARPEPTTYTLEDTDW